MQDSLSVKILTDALTGTEIIAANIAIASARYEEGHIETVEVKVTWGEEISVSTKPKDIRHEGNLNL